MCNICNKYEDGNILMENENCFAIRDERENNHGNILVYTKRHVGSFFDLSNEENEDLNMLLKNCKNLLETTLYPDGYNVVFNVGYWGGQVSEHCYAELIPRYAGDVPVTEVSKGLRVFKGFKDGSE